MCDNLVVRPEYTTHSQHVFCQEPEYVGLK